MGTHTEEMHRKLEQIFAGFPQIHTADIPGIDLYMDQVTTFLQEKLRGLSRDPEGDKFLTKTMINNYVKNKILIPPVKKKYSREHLMLLIMIYNMKSFLSIGDIQSIVGPVMERYASQPQDRKKETADRKRESADKETGTGKSARSGIGISGIYEEVLRTMEESLPRIQEDIDAQINQAAGDFADVPGEEQELLQRFSLICRLSAEVYMRKLFIEKLLDEQKKPARSK